MFFKIEWTKIQVFKSATPPEFQAGDALAHEYFNRLSPDVNKQMRVYIVWPDAYYLRAFRSFRFRSHLFDMGRAHVHSVYHVCIQCIVCIADENNTIPKQKCEK